MRDRELKKGLKLFSDNVPVPKEWSKRTARGSRDGTIRVISIPIRGRVEGILYQIHERKHRDNLFVPIMMCSSSNTTVAAFAHQCVLHTLESRA